MEKSVFHLNFEASLELSLAFLKSMELPWREVVRSNSKEKKTMPKKILITGENSYIGNSFIKYCSGNKSYYQIDKLNVRGERWKQFDFSLYESVIHVAGIAHLKETEIDDALYYSVNRDLAVQVAEKAKLDGVKQFIFLSTMSIYGVESGVINNSTPINPTSHYGKSKRQAEKLIKPLASSQFQIAIIRPPMVYGQDCKGNYPKLSKFVRKYKVFPNIKNQRSMIYIENLVESIKLILDYQLTGIFCPQNEEYVQTTNLAKMIGKVNHFKVITVPNLLNIFSGLAKNNSTFNKVAGSLVYDKGLSTFATLDGKDLNYNVIDFMTSVKKTELKLY